MKRGGRIAACFWLAWYGDPDAEGWTLFARACGVDTDAQRITTR